MRDPLDNSALYTRYLKDAAPVVYDSGFAEAMSTISAARR